MNIDSYKKIVHTIPADPGIYKYFGEGGEVLYVGKAKNLRKRLSSYFLKNQDNYKTKKLVEQIHHLEFTLVDSEQDAFLLENSLIKQFQPKFNINLKDDKTYPFIVIKREPFPRVFLTRNHLKDGSEYLGPFTSVGKVRELLEFIRNNIPMRTCTLNLTANNIRRKKFKVCLEYHLGNCKGPCEGYQSMEDYQQNLQQVKNILKGNLSPVIAYFKEMMMAHVQKLEFEKAQIWHRKIDQLQDYQAKSTIVNPRITQADVFSIQSDDTHAFVNYLMILNGTVAESKTITLEKKLDESDGEVLEYAISSLRETFQSIAAEIIVPFKIHYPQKDMLITVPKGGDKKKLLDLSEKNVIYFKEELRKIKRLHLVEKTSEQKKKVLDQLQEDLQLPVVPVHIECFDNSNFQGSFPVAACVVFRDGAPSNKEYRHYNIRTVKGINDFASMEETVFRRYKRLMEENRSLPQLVIIDGGKGQLSSAMASIEKLGLTGRMILVGLAKNMEELFFPGDTVSIQLPYESESLRLIRQIRDEVHRFGISFHRQKRSQGTFKNELETIPGIGPATATQLLQFFRSVQKIRSSSLEELTLKAGAQKAQIIWNHFHPQ
ncbi:MAG: excinuclease ABC subunit UvrC [Chitinophagaceae bacterium]